MCGQQCVRGVVLCVCKPEKVRINESGNVCVECEDNYV